MTTKLINGLILLGLGFVIVPAQGALITYASNPTGNSTDWTNAVIGLGGTINTNVNFNSHPTGPLLNAHYTVSDGVTFLTTGVFSGVESTAGPSDGTTTGTTSPGEGVHAVSNTLLTPKEPFANNTTFTVSFADAVLGAGLFTVDYFDNTTSTIRMSLEAYDGVAGTGTLLGTAEALDLNFQDPANSLYFLGVSDSTNVIRSIKLIHNGGVTGDSIGIDDIRFATLSTAVPEPSSFALMIIAIGAIGLIRCRYYSPLKRSA